MLHLVKQASESVSKLKTITPQLQKKMVARYYFLEGTPERIKDLILPTGKYGNTTFSLRYYKNDILILFYYSYIEFMLSFNKRAKQTISIDFKAKNIRNFNEEEAHVFVHNIKVVEAHWRKKGFKTKLKPLRKNEKLPELRLTISTRDGFK